LASRNTLAIMLFAAFFLSAVLAFPVSAQGPWYHEDLNTISKTWNTWYPAASIAVMVAFLVAAVAYMIGYGFNLRGLKTWAKAEFYQAIASALLVVGLVLLTFLMFEYGFSAILPKTGTGPTDPYFVAYNYLVGAEKTASGDTRLMLGLYIADGRDAAGKVIWKDAPSAIWSWKDAPEKIKDLGDLVAYNEASAKAPTPIEDLLIFRYQSIYVANFALELISTFSSYQNSGVNIPIGLFLKPLLIEPMHMVAHMIMQVLLMTYMMTFLLQFFETTMFSVFLPLGLFLRIFPPTRSAGALLMAFAIGFYVVFPITFAFITILSDDTSQEPFNPAQMGVDLADFDACSDDFESILGETQQNTSPEVVAKINQFGSFLPALWIKVFFYPIVIFAVTLTFIKMLSPILGADISELGQGLMKMI